MLVDAFYIYSCAETKHTFYIYSCAETKHTFYIYSCAKTKHTFRIQYNKKHSPPARNINDVNIAQHNWYELYDFPIRK
jgi:hypothetical protein